MRNLYLLICASFISQGIIAQSPIVIGNNNMPGNGDTLRYTNVQPNSIGNYTQSGTNYNWDFSNVASINEGIREFKNAILTPYAFFFIGFNEYGEKIADTISAGPLTITKYYNYYKKQNSPVNAFIADGVGMTFSSVPVPGYFTDKDELYFFPMTYPKYDSSTFKFATPTTSLLPLNYSKSGYRITKVDGWGSVKTPFGTENCLRIVTTQYSMDTVKTNMGPFPLPPFGFPNFQRSYQWLTLNSKIPFFEVSGNLTNNNFTPNMARYRGRKAVMPPPPPPDTTGIEFYFGSKKLEIYPNPVHNQLKLLHLPEGNYSFGISDSKAKLIYESTLAINNEETVLDLLGLESGLYFLRISKGQQVFHYKFIKD